MQPDRTPVAARSHLRLPTSRPDLRSSAAEGIGREGMVTVWDDQGRYVGCMGIETWIAFLAARNSAIEPKPRPDAGRMHG